MMSHSGYGNGTSLDLDHIEKFLFPGTPHDIARVSGLHLCSHYQPIYSLAHQRVVGYEALARPYYSNGDPLLPTSLFASTQDMEEKVFLDRVCRALHVRNFVRQGDDTSWLFLNVDPAVTAEGRFYGTFFRQLLERYGIPPHRIVVEILEGRIDDEAMLGQALRYYKDIGCLVALDDFGVGHSNFDRIWRVAPHIIKLDRSIIVQADNNRTVRRVLPNLVRLIHEAGSLALMEGIENTHQALIAVEAEIDFVQGYFFSRPDEKLVQEHDHPLIRDLFDRTRQSRALEEGARETRFAPYAGMMRTASQQIQDGIAVETALAPFLALPQTRRCYQLDTSGVQIGANLTAAHAPAPWHPGAQFKPMSDAANAIWMRRHYFQNAISEPDRVHVSKPYLSITDGNLCVTLSIAIRSGGDLRVLCGDIDWVDG